MLRVIQIIATVFMVMFFLNGLYEKELKMRILAVSSAVVLLVIILISIFIFNT